MTISEPFEFQVELTVDGATDEDTDKITRQLMAELRNSDIESVSLLKNGNAPLGTKSTDPINIGALAVVVLPTLLPKVIDFIQAWSLRGQGKTVKFKGKVNNQVIEFEGTSQELENLINKLEKGKKKK